MSMDTKPHGEAPSSDLPSALRYHAGHGEFYDGETALLLREGALEIERLGRELAAAKAENDRIRVDRSLERARLRTENEAMRHDIERLTASKDGMVSVPETVILSAIRTLTADGDEHGVARFLSSALAAAKGGK